MIHDNLKSALDKHQAGNLADAEFLYKEILKGEPNNFEALHLLSILDAQQKNYQEALSSIQRAIVLKPDNHLLYNTAGNIFNKLGLFDEAKRQFYRALDIAPNSASSHNNLANVLYSLNQLEEAALHYAKAIEAKPDYIDAHFNLGLIFLKRGEETKAVEKLLLVIGLDQSHLEAHKQLARVYYERNDISKAINYYVICLRIDSDDIDVLKELGSILAEKESFQTAVQHLQKVLKIKPNDIEALQNLGAIFLLKNDLDAALQYYLKILSIQPDCDSYYNAGVIYMDQNRNGEALAYFNEALKLKPNDFRILYNLGAAYLKMDDYGKSAENYRKALEIKPDDEEIRYLLAAIESSSNEKIIKAAPKAYVQHLFDQYAPYFDEHLTKGLQYKVPELLYQTFKNMVSDNNDGLMVLDLGCGTGLCGEKFRKSAKNLIGVDLSKVMLSAAEKKHIYDELIQEDISKALISYHSVIDLIIAGDSLVYFGDLDEIFRNCESALKKDGYFLFTCERTEEYPFTLRRSARFAHTEKYIKELITKHHFKIVKSNEVTLREQKNEAVAGFLFLITH